MLESAIRYESQLIHGIFSAQTKRATVKMTDKNSPQKSVSDQMGIQFAPDCSFAHIRPCGGEGKLVTSSCADEQAGANSVVRTGSG